MQGARAYSSLNISFVNTIINLPWGHVIHSLGNPFLHCSCNENGFYRKMK